MTKLPPSHATARQAKDEIARRYNVRRVQGTAVSSPPAKVISAAGEPPTTSSNAHFQFFNPYAEIRQTDNRLPHWQQNGAVYFVTFRLADSIPFHLLRDWNREREAWLKLHPEPWTDGIELEYHELFSGQIERWLDAGHGCCGLRRPECAALLDGAFRHFEATRIKRVSSVVMPNHAHVLFVQNHEFPIQKIVRSWKSYTAREINSMNEEKGSLWQRDYFDRLIRDEEHFANCVRYIRRNPAKARLRSGDYILWESDIARQID